MIYAAAAAMQKNSAKWLYGMAHIYISHQNGLEETSIEKKHTNVTENHCIVGAAESDRSRIQI